MFPIEEETLKMKRIHNGGQISLTTNSVKCNGCKGDNVGLVLSYPREFSKQDF